MPARRPAPGYTREGNVRWYCGFIVAFLLLCGLKYNFFLCDAGRAASAWGGASLGLLLDGAENAASAGYDRGPARELLASIAGSLDGLVAARDQAVEPAGAAAGGPCEDTMPAGAAGAETDQQYLLIGIVPQQFVSAVLQGVRRFLRTSAVLGRVAVIPNARFHEPGLRMQFRDVPYPGREPYYPLCELLDYPSFMTSWNCLSRTTADRWASATQRVVDAYVFVLPGPARRNACPLEKWLLSGLEKPMPNGTYLQGSAEIKLLDTLQGRVAVKEVLCVAPDITTEDLVAKLAGYKSVMISQPPFTFLKKGWDVCPGNKVSSLKVAKPWQVVGNSFIKEKLSRAPPGWRAPPRAPALAPGGDNHGCVHLRFEKLVRHFLLAGQTVPFRRIAGGVASEKLETCLAAVVEMTTYMARQTGGRLFLMHDMQDEFGTATTHFDGKISGADYKAWTVWAQRTLSRSLPEYQYYCGSDAHTADKANTNSGDPDRDVASRILTGNPRACALVETAVCTKAKKRMRMGDGSFGQFVTNINLNLKSRRNGGSQWGYQSCAEIEADAAKCREAGDCVEVKLRNDTELAPMPRSGTSLSGGAAKPLARRTSYTTRSTTTRSTPKD